MKKHPLKQWRDSRDLSLAAAAKMVGVTSQAWHFWERGQTPGSRRIKKLAKVTGIGVERLLNA